MTLRGALRFGVVSWVLKGIIFTFMSMGDGIEVGVQGNKSIARLSPARIHMLLEESDIISLLIVLRPRCRLCLFVSYL